MWHARGLPTNNLAPFQNSLAASHLLNALSTLHPPRVPGRHSAPSPSSPLPPVEVLPPIPTDDDEDSWLAFQQMVHIALRQVRTSIRSTLRHSLDSPTHRRRLVRLLFVAPRIAHRRIFTPATDITTPSDLVALLIPGDPLPTSDPDRMTTHVHQYYSEAWTATPLIPSPSTPPVPTLHQPHPSPSPSTHIPPDPYPWNTGQHIDRFDLCPLPNPSHPLPTSLLPYVLRSHTFDHTMKGLRTNKAPGADNIPNELLRIMPDTFKQSLRSLFIIFWICGHTPST